MITINYMKWSNWFSYGDDNEIIFTKNPLTQITGINGAGKTSIQLILEEIMTNKNSKGIKKQEILNRNTDSKVATATLNFHIDEEQYIITLRRTSTVKVQLFKGGVDISSHTSTNTYKTIEGLLGVDFKTFAQLIYQSSTSSLQFLSATDTNRKKFLISLFNLDEYLVIHETFKSAYREVNKVVAGIDGSCSTVKKWIDTHNNLDTSDQKLVEVPIMPENEVKELGNLETSLKNITSINRKRNNNNNYRDQLEGLDKSALAAVLEKPEDISDIIKENSDLLAKKNIELNMVREFNLVPDKCPTCKRDIDISDTKLRISEAEDKLKILNKELSIKATLISENASIKATYFSNQKVLKEFEDLTNYIDVGMSREVLEEGDLSEKISSITTLILGIKREIESGTRTNNAASAKNAENKVIREQLVKYESDLNTLVEELEEATKLLSKLNVLKNSFSTNGLIGYKIESLVKNLENEINKYLTDLTGGSFYVAFALVGDKLNVEIIENDAKVSIETLSAGELARVNISTLLAIRKMMSIISSTEVNILFLDEIMGTLDAEGKDKLIEILLEEDLNTMIVAHDYSHPLIPAINVIKEDNISRLEE